MALQVGLTAGAGKKTLTLDPFSPLPSPLGKGKRGRGVGVKELVEISGEPKIQSLRSKIAMGLIALVVVAADQVTKGIVASRIPDRGIVPVIPGFFNLTSTRNSGAVFGFFSEWSVWWKTPLLIAISVALLIAVLTLVLRSTNLHWGTRIGLALVVGGALSNLFDRVRYGMVEDFLDFYIRSYHWATFNVADSAIVVGTGLIILQVLFGGS